MGITTLNMTPWKLASDEMTKAVILDTRRLYFARGITNFGLLEFANVSYAVNQSNGTGLIYICD